MNRSRRALVWLGAVVLLLAGNEARAAMAPVGSPAPVVFTSGAGRFEVIGPDAASTSAVVTLAEVAWRTLVGPLALPPGGFGQPIIVRLMPEEHEVAPKAVFRVLVEPGGLVSVRVRWRPEMPADHVRRALVQSLLMRLGVAWHGAGANLAVPLWLEKGCVGWWVTRANPARLDQWQQEAEQAVPVDVARLLAWERGDDETRALTLASLWLFSQLGQEGGRSGAWRLALSRLLAGENAGVAFGNGFPMLAGGGREAELWWQVAREHQRRDRAMPLQTIGASQRWLGELTRVVLARAGEDHVLTPEQWWADRDVSAVRQAMADRIRYLGTELPLLHPFYHNAALSLGMMFEAVLDGEAEAFAVAREQFDRDAQEALELSETSAAALDVLNAVGK